MTTNEDKEALRKKTLEKISENSIKMKEISAIMAASASILNYQGGDKDKNIENISTFATYHIKPVELQGYKHVERLRDEYNSFHMKLNSLVMEYYRNTVDILNHSIVNTEIHINN